MTQPLRSDLRARARLRADQDSQDFPTDAQYNLFLDEAAKQVWADLIAGGWPADFTTNTVTFVGGIPAAFEAAAGAIFSVIGVWYQSGSEWVELHRLNEADRASLMSQTGGMPSFYDLRSGISAPSITVYPVGSAGSVRVDYIVEHPGFTSDSSVWYGPFRSDEMIVLQAARKGVLKEGRVQDAQILAQEYAELKQTVTALASWYDQRNPAQIRDVMSRPARGAFDYPVGGPEWFW